jgi:hypothetical protein
MGTAMGECKQYLGRLAAYEDALLCVLLADETPTDVGRR